jgi:hypothetical protein
LFITETKIDFVGQDGTNSSTTPRSSEFSLRLSHNSSSNQVHNTNEPDLTNRSEKRFRQPNQVTDMEVADLTDTYETIPMAN